MAVVTDKWRELWMVESKGKEKVSKMVFVKVVMKVLHLVW
jgi:hypothetical protein